MAPHGRESPTSCRGHGTEEYALRNLVPGTYRIQANYYGSQQQKLIGSVTLKVVVFTNYGRPDEEMREITVRLPEAKSVVDVGSVDLAGEE